MRNPLLRPLLIAGLAIAGSGCSGPSPPVTVTPNPVSAAVFGAPQSLATGESLTYDDGLNVLLETINDSRCRQDVQCIWAGELAPELRLRGGSIGSTEQALILGTERAREKAVAGYRLVLSDATETSITLSITRSAVQSRKPDETVRITRPQPGQAMTSPFTVTGEARGRWYFEASFPVKLLDANGKLLVQTHAQAQGEWMTAEFVPFTSTLEFPQSTTTTGTLVLEKDNPSGEPQHADSRSFPVRFATVKANGGDTGVRGVVTIGPTCPVARYPPDPNCGDKPYAGAFSINTQAGKRIATVTSNQDGKFSLALPAGKYVIHLQGTNAMPSMAPQEFSVPRTGYTEVQLILDSGIR